MSTLQTEMVAELLQIPGVSYRTRYAWTRLCIQKEELIYQREAKADAQWRKEEARLKAARNAPGKRVRIWEYIHGLVKLTLAPGQCLMYHEGGPTDEGYTRIEHMWEYDIIDQVIKYEQHHYSRDCDGPMSHHIELVLPIDEIVPHTCPNDLPWRKVSAYQRDYYAEAMGY